MKIILFTRDDAPDVTRFFSEIFTELGFTKRASDYMDEPQKLFHIPHGGLLLIAKENGRVIGTAGIILLNNTDGLIKRFYVQRTYRGTGLAQQLLEQLRIRSKTLGVKRFILDVSKNNHQAIAFYKKSGFLPTHVEEQGNWPESKEPETHFFFTRQI